MGMLVGPIFMPIPLARRFPQHPTMSILRCNKCFLLQEHPDTSIGQSIPCPRCASPVTVYPTLFFVEKLLARYFDAQKELAALRPAAVAVSVTAPSALDVDLGNTDQFASDFQHGPIYDWFRKKQIRVQANTRAVDTSGFFDELGEAIGANLPVLGDVLHRIFTAQRKEFASTVIHLDRKSPEDALVISAFCQQLYDFSFVAKCLHNRKESNIRLVLQTAPAIQNFFAGEWLEWHTLMTSLRYAKERGRRFSCSRGLDISLQNGEAYEIDVFVLIDGNIPVCIECKSGEFREKIDRYQTLKKRLGLGGKQFVMCIAGLSDENAKAFSAMYDLAFVSERSLADHLARLF